MPRVRRGIGDPSRRTRKPSVRPWARGADKAGSCLVEASPKRLRGRRSAGGFCTRARSLHYRLRFGCRASAARPPRSRPEDHRPRERYGSHSFGPMGLCGFSQQRSPAESFRNGAEPGVPRAAARGRPPRSFADLLLVWCLSMKAGAETLRREGLSAARGHGAQQTQHARDALIVVVPRIGHDREMAVSAERN